jgi:hypothetical protein
VTAIQSKAPFWPLELEVENLIIELQKTRQADFLLARLVEFADTCALLPELMHHAAREAAVQRLRMVADLVDRYERLLLERFEAYKPVEGATASSSAFS